MKIVLAVDGSKHARWAMQWVRQLPLVDPPRVVAVHALDLVSLRAPFMVQPVVAGNEPYIQLEIKRLEKQAQRVVTEAKEFLASSGLSGKVLLEKGVPSQAVLKHARRGDLIVLGSRGLNPLDRFMLGSVSTQVTLHAPCSVLVVKQAPRPIRRLLLATDGSQSAHKALRFLCDAWRPEATEVVVAHVMPFLRYPELKVAGRHLVDRQAERLAKAGYTVREALKLGRPADELIALAEAHKVDAVVAGAKGLGAIARFFLGSVSTKLIHHSPASVLVVR
ncbi:universal stress protein [Candidatus Nitrospira bockiana]